MSKATLRGFWATCAFLAMATGVQAASTDVVLYSNDAVKTAGNWARVAEKTAAGGQELSSTDKGWSSTDTAIASPNDYIEFTFNAPASTPHHVWVRMRAAADNKYNDSIFLQFSDAVNGSGAPVYRMGTTNALTLNLAQNANGKMNGWGWVDGAYWLSQASTVSFGSSGTHTVRIQTREDGAQIDQIVLSPATYLSTAPGQVSGDSTIIAKPAAPAPRPTPFSGKAITLPGTLEAEDFDNGGEGVAYHDADDVNSGGAYRASGIDLEGSSEGGYDLGWISPGEWLAYSVDVKSSGKYVLDARVASPSQGGIFHVEFNGVDVTGPLSIPATGGWQNWTTVSQTVMLSGGPQLAKVVFDAASASSAVGNLNWLRVSPAPSQPYSGTPVSLPGSIAVDKFDEGGEGLAYHDTSAGNWGGVSRDTDVDIENSSLGTADIGWIEDGEWVAYSVNVAAAGDYVITAKVSSPYTSGRMHVTVGSVVKAPVLIPQTGSWQTWQEVHWTAALAAGPQVLAMVFDTGGFNVAGLSVTKAVAPDVDPVPPTTPTRPPSSTDNTVVVEQGGDLQAAINAAKPGDTILLAAGATFTGNFSLPAKSGNEYITIRTNIADPVPAGVRITPQTAVNLAKIKSPNTYTALATEAYAHHYILQLLEFKANVNGNGEVISLGDGSDAQNSLAMVPHNLIVDRVYVHGDAAGQKRGIGLNSASTTIRDSYIANIWFVGQDSQAICGWNGPGPYLVTNNYLEAASENFLMGGADPAILNLIPSDITFTKNYVTKPLSWRSNSDINVKNLFELKNGARVLVDGNIFENNWMAAQAGYAIVLTGRSQDGRAPWSIVEDFTFTNNIVRHVASAINILGQDYRFPSGISHNIVFKNNLFYDVNGSNWGGDGRFMLVNGGYDITVDHNTVLQSGNSVLYGDTNPVQGFTMTNNIVPDNAWAIMGGGTSPGNGTIATFFPGSTILRTVFAGGMSWIYPTGNYYPASMSEVGFVNLAGGDYHLAPTSIYRNAALDGTDVGADIDAILSATAGVK